MALAGKITLAVITVDTPMNRRKVSIVWPNESIIADGYSLKQMGENEGSTFTLYVNQAVANTLRGKVKTVSGVVVPVLTVGPLLGDAELKTAQMVNGKDFSIMTRFLHGTGIDLYIGSNCRPVSSASAVLSIDRDLAHLGLCAGVLCPLGVPHDLYLRRYA